MADRIPVFTSKVKEQPAKFRDSSRDEPPVEQLSGVHTWDTDDLEADVPLIGQGRMPTKEECLEAARKLGDPGWGTFTTGSTAKDNFGEDGFTETGSTIAASVLSGESDATHLSVQTNSSAGASSINSTSSRGKSSKCLLNYY